MKRLLIEAAVVLAAFAAAYFPGRWHADETRRASEEERKTITAKLEETEASYKIAALQAELGLVLVEVEEDNIGRARERATQFFDRLRETIPAIPAGRAEPLRTLLARRDEITADLVTSSPGTAAKLRKLYAQFLGQDASK